MLGGLIAGALGGAAKGYTQMAEGELQNQQRLDFQREISKMEEERLLRIDEIKRTRDVEDIPRRTSAQAAADAAAAPVRAQGEATAAPIRAQGEAAAAPIRAQGEAAAAPIRAQGEVAGAAARIDAATAAGLPQKKATYERAEFDAGKDLARDRATFQGQTEGAGYVAKVNAPGYTSAKAKDTAAGESSATRAAAAATNFELSQKRAVADLRTQLTKTKDPDDRAFIQQQISDLAGTSTKSYGDMVTAAGHYRMLAQNLRKDAEMATTEDERTDMMNRARYYEQEADGILQTTKGLRLGKSAKPTSGPNAGAAPAASGAPVRGQPWTRFSSPQQSDGLSGIAAP
jgi:hypothetical protein